MTRPFTSVGNMIDDKEYVFGIQLSHAFFFAQLVTEGSIITKTSLLDKLQQKIVYIISIFLYFSFFEHLYNLIP